jgi:acyl carrier protein
MKDKLREIIVTALRRNIDPGSVEGSDLVDELGITSVDSLEILIAVENEFDILVPDDDLNQSLLSSIDNLASYIEKRKADQ